MTKTISQQLNRSNLPLDYLYINYFQLNQHYVDDLESIMHNLKTSKYINAPAALLAKIHYYGLSNGRCVMVLASDEPIDNDTITSLSDAIAVELRTTGGTAPVIDTVEFNHRRFAPINLNAIDKYAVKVLKNNTCETQSVSTSNILGYRLKAILK